jgi:tetratricopeptide (TPR) repeat protein
MKKVTCLLLLFISITCFSQTVQELEGELHIVRMRNGETSTSKKEVAIKLLGMDKYNVEAANYLIRVFTQNNQKDSINDLVNRLIRENPKSPEPYVLIAQLVSTPTDQRMGYYEEACKQDSLHTKANYELGKYYYQLFIKEFAESQKKKILDEYSRSSIKHFSTLCNQDSSYLEALSYPLLQLATYLGDAALIKRFRQFNVQQYHFPVSAFVDLPTDWQTDFTVDVMNWRYRKMINGKYTEPEINIVGVEDAKFHIEWYSSDLRALKEPVLNTFEAENVYRFTLLFSPELRTVVGLVNTNDSIYVYWKACDQSGIVRNEHTKTLTQKEWTAIDSAFHSIDFWNMPSIKVDPSTITLHASHWIMEGKVSGKYHVVERESDDDIQAIGNQLFKLADNFIRIGR